MNKTAWICFSLISSALVIFYSAFFYFIGMKENDTGLSERVAGVVSVIRDDNGYQEPSMVAGHAIITEQRMVFGLFLISLVLLLSSVCLATYKRIKQGNYRNFSVIVFSSVTVLLCILYTAEKYELYRGL